MWTTSMRHTSGRCRRAASPCASRRTSSTGTAAPGSKTGSATNGGWRPTSKTFRWRRCSGARRQWRKPDENRPRQKRRRPGEPGRLIAAGAVKAILARGVGRLAGGLARGRLRAAVSSAIADGLDGRACAADGFSRRLDRGLTGRAVGLDHAPHDLTALALAVRKLVEELACKVQYAPLGVRRRADRGGVEAADVTRGRGDPPGKVDRFALATLDLVDELPGDAVTPVIGRLGGVEERVIGLVHRGEELVHILCPGHWSNLLLTTNSSRCRIHIAAI